MEYKEAPSINDANRKFVFPVIKWLTKSKFEEYLNLELTNPLYSKIYPYINSIDDVGEDSISNRVFIGKSIPINTDEGHSIRYYSYRANPMNLEVIGSVGKNLSGEWELRVPHGSSVTIIKRDFLVLCISDPESFQWIRTEKNRIPKYALRGANDEFTSEYFYIGKTIREVKPRIYRESTWQTLHEDIPNLFGKIHVGHECLYVPYNNNELSFTQYDALCLKPSPASLKILCRLKVREMAKYSNKTIGLINSKRKLLPDTLLNFVKYPSFLSVGEYMLKGEKITDDNFEIMIENNGDLVCKSVVDDTNRDSLEHVKRIIQNGVHSIWLNRFQVVFCLTNGHTKIAHGFFNQSPEYKLSINYSVIPPDYQVTEVTND